MKKINSILNEVLKNINPSETELKEINNFIGNFVKNLKERIKTLRVSVEVFIGGSFAKNTVIKRDKYDVDIFLRFDKKYSEKEISHLSKKILAKTAKKILVHGSRDYFKIKIKENFIIEIIPVKKIKNPDESENTTDLSFLHVNYIRKKIKKKELLHQIMLAKAFCYANNCYGAESYINGFSGYALELLIYHYGNFLNFIKKIAKTKNEKLVIDLENHYKNKKIVLMELNASKLNSPIILIDPTYKYRNALAALSSETFERFKNICEKFLENPDLKYFELKRADINKIKSDAESKKFEFILLEVSTKKPEGDVAGSKLLKFYRHLTSEIGKYFEIKDNGFNYNKKFNARYFFVSKDKKDFVIRGPEISDEKNTKAFEKVHKDYFTKNGRLYSKEKIDFNLKEFLEMWKNKNKKKIKEMYINDFKIVDNNN